MRYQTESRKGGWSSYADMYATKLSRNHLDADRFDVLSERFQNILRHLEKYDQEKADRMSDALARLYLSKGNSYIRGLNSGFLQASGTISRTLERGIKFLENRKNYRAEAATLREWYGYTKEKENTREKAAKQGRKPSTSSFRSYFRHILPETIAFF
jgi:hypothetical protein